MMIVSLIHYKMKRHKDQFFFITDQIPLDL